MVTRTIKAKQKQLKIDREIREIYRILRGTAYENLPPRYNEELVSIHLPNGSAFQFYSE